jgi:hypothetical protein
LTQDVSCIIIIFASDSRMAVTEGFPSGQRGQTVNLLATLSKVQILPPPPNNKTNVVVLLEVRSMKLDV